MPRIELNHWFIKDNKLSISLWHFYVAINMFLYDDEIIFQLKVNDDEKNYMGFNFFTLEDAIDFTENVIANSSTLDDILNKYRESREKQKYGYKKVKSISIL